ncbi:MAG: ABC transporter ATP-binding protein [Muribaculaceae bacterium]|nr:ABC transporter ATP-binding protein [Muribaculaceae bacterium]
MLKIKNCSFSYRRKGNPTIDDFSLTLEEGGVYGLLGSNGAGKSTLLQLITGLLTPISGEILFDGENTRKRLPSTMKDIFLVPEEIELPAMKLDSFIKYNSVFYPNFSMEDMNRHLELLELQRDIRLDKLSMGQKKKVALAFAMACNTKLLLMDEPTNGLDIPAKSAFRKFIAQSMTDDRIFVISTHQVRDVSQILDHVLIMNNSKVLLDSTVANIQSKLKFADTINRELIDNAIYAIKGVGGASVILPNDNDEDSELNLELLFDFAINEPEKLKQALSINNPEN